MRLSCVVSPCYVVRTVLLGYNDLYAKGYLLSNHRCVRNPTTREPSLDFLT